MNQYERLQRKAEEAQNLVDLVHQAKMLLWDIGALASIPESIRESTDTLRQTVVKIHKENES